MRPPPLTINFTLQNNTDPFTCRFSLSTLFYHVFNVKRHHDEHHDRHHDEHHDRHRVVGRGSSGGCRGTRERLCETLKEKTNINKINKLTLFYFIDICRRRGSSGCRRGVVGGSSEGRRRGSSERVVRGSSEGRER